MLLEITRGLLSVCVRLLENPVYIYLLSEGVCYRSVTGDKVGEERAI